MRPIHMTRRYLHLWRSLAARSITAQLAYRGDFLLGVLRNLGGVALAIIFYQVLFLRTESIAGWSRNEVLVLFGTFRVVKGILAFLVEDNITALPDLVRSGEFDFALLKPVNTRFLLSCTTVNLGALADTAVGFGIVIYATRTLPGVGVGAIALYIGLVACAVVIFANLLFALLTVSFWAGKVDGLQFLFDELLNLAGLPVSVYRGALGAAVSYVIPLGLAATVPAGVIAGHRDLFFVAYAPLFAVASSIGAHFFWRRAVGSYTSAGG